MDIVETHSVIVVVTHFVTPMVLMRITYDQIHLLIEVVVFSSVSDPLTHYISLSTDGSLSHR